MGDNFRAVQPLYGRKVGLKNHKNLNVECSNMGWGGSLDVFPNISKNQKRFWTKLTRVVPGDSQRAGVSPGDQAYEAGGGAGWKAGPA